MSRFDDISERELTILLEHRDSFGTNNVIKCAVSVLRYYCSEKHLDFPSKTIEKSELNILSRNSDYTD